MTCGVQVHSQKAILEQAVFADEEEEKYAAKGPERMDFFRRLSGGLRKTSV